jgi:hypothetical protein
VERGAPSEGSSIFEFRVSSVRLGLGAGGWASGGREGGTYYAIWVRILEGDSLWGGEREIGSIRAGNIMERRMHTQTSFMSLPQDDKCTPITYF